MKDSHIERNNSHDYPLVRIAKLSADFESHVLPFDDMPTGVGDMGIPSAAPALTNAIFAATGLRIWKLPIKSQRQDWEAESTQLRQSLRRIGDLDSGGKNKAAGPAGPFLAGCAQFTHD